MRRPHRFTIDVDDELHEKLKDCVPWGNRTHVFNAVLKLICEAIEKDGAIVIGALLANQFKIVWKDK